MRKYVRDHPFRAAIGSTHVPVGRVEHGQPSCDWAFCIEMLRALHSLRYDTLEIEFLTSSSLRPRLGCCGKDERMFAGEGMGTYLYTWSPGWPTMCWMPPL